MEKQEENEKNEQKNSDKKVKKLFGSNNSAFKKVGQ